MNEETILEGDVVEMPKPEEEEETPAEAPTGEGEGEEEKKEETKKGSSASFKDAWKQVETFGQALSEALQGRGNVVMVRVNDEALQHLDMLIEAEVTKSRSESAAFLINEGIKTNQPLFDKISTITQQIVELREQLRAEVQLGPKEEEAEA